MAGAGLSPQLTATTMRFPAVLLAAKACAMEALAESFVKPAVCTKLIAAPAVVTGEPTTVIATNTRRADFQSRLSLFMTFGERHMVSGSPSQWPIQRA